MAEIRKFNQRKRNRAHRKRKAFVIIGCEGKTEKTYFKNYNSEQCKVKFSHGNSTNPKGVVQDLIQYIDNNIELEENDIVYAVFDTDLEYDKHKQIKEAKTIAKKHNIEIVTSTPSFELWFLLHFGYTTKVFVSNSELIDELEKWIPNYSKSQNTFGVVRDLTAKAIKNAKKLEQHQLDSGKELDNENCNPYTGVYKITEELIKRNKKVE